MYVHTYVSVSWNRDAYVSLIVFTIHIITHYCGKIDVKDKMCKTIISWPSYVYKQEYISFAEECTTAPYGNKPSKNKCAGAGNLDTDNY